MTLARRRGWTVAAAVCGAVLWTAQGLAAAQVGAGQITGRVLDPAGADVVGARVTAVNVDTGTERQTVTSEAGLYTFAGLNPGRYRIEVGSAGFKPARRDDVRVETGETSRLDFDLTVGEVTQTVLVTAAAPALRTTGSLGTVISEEKIVGLPLNGRSFITLASLAPGVAIPPGSPLPRINGGRPRTNEYLYDGISVLQPEPGQVAFFPIVDAIQEFRIETNSPPAEFGRFNGGVVNLTTRSGGNAWRGTAFGFLRHEALNARNAFAAPGSDKPAFRRTQAGGVLGGPIVRNRTFFFVDYQGQRQRVARPVISTVPTLLQRQGVFTEPIAGVVPVIYDPATTTPSGTTFTRTAFAGNTIPLDRMDPVALALLQRYPLPTSSGTANNFRRTGDEADDQDQWDVRVDHRFTANDLAFARLTSFRGTFTPVTPLPDGSGVTTGTLGPQDTKSWSFASSYRRVISSSLLNELRVGDTRRTVERSATQLDGSPAQVLGLPGLPANAGFPNTLPLITITGYQQLGSPANTATDFNTSVTEVADSLTWVTGAHTVKMGLDWRWERLNVIQPPSPTGSFAFNLLGSNLPGAGNTGTPLASFLLGQVQTFSIDVQQQEIQERARVQEYFVQDDWRISDTLTINPGLRYTLNFPSTEINGQTAVLNLQTQLLEYPGDQPVRPLKKNNLGPRLGITYRPTGKTVASVGYGLVYIEMAGITTPFTTPTFPFLQTVSQRSLDGVSPAFLLKNGPTVSPIAPTPTAGYGQGVFSVDGDLGSGYVQQWNAAVQRELSAGINVEVAYVGSKITHVGIPDSNLNQLSVEQLALGSTLTSTQVPNPYFGIIPRSSTLGDPTIPLAQALKPYPQYTTVSLYRNNVGNTNYHGLTVKLEKRFSRGLSYLVSYTRSRLMDDASSVFDASILTGPLASFQVADSFNRRLERDYSTGDTPHVFVASGVWALPWGRNGAHPSWVGAVSRDWVLSAVVTLQSGMPVAVTQTNLNSFAGFGSQRPNLVGEPEVPSDERSAARWFNTAAFALAPQFTIGSASRNPVRGPSYRNVDVAVSRRIPLGARPDLEVRVEAFNLLNTPPLGAPNATFGAANFGSITTAGDPRVIQLGLKVLF